jgi:hypothetical protein
MACSGTALALFSCCIDMSLTRFALLAANVRMLDFFEYKVVLKTSCQNRHPCLSLRPPRGISATKAKPFTPDYVRKFFCTVETEAVKVV